MRTLSWSALLMTLVGCAGDTTGSDTDVTGDTADTDTDTVVGDCTDGGIALEVGSGELAFEALSSGDGVNMVHGPQGGWHLEAAGRVVGAKQEISILPKIVLSGMGDLQVAGDQQAQFVALANYDAETCTGDFFGVRTFLDDVLTPPNGGTYQEFICEMAGTATLEITVEDITTGASVTESVEFTLGADPTDPC